MHNSQFTKLKLKKRNSRFWKLSYDKIVIFEWIKRKTDLTSRNSYDRSKEKWKRIDHGTKLKRWSVISPSFSFIFIHDTRGRSANRVDHVRRNHYHWSSSLSLLSSHSLSPPPRLSTRIELSANCHRGRRSRGRKIVNTRIRSFLWHRERADFSLSLSLSPFVLQDFRDFEACWI